MALGLLDPLPRPTPIRPGLREDHPVALPQVGLVAARYQFVKPERDRSGFPDLEQSLRQVQFHRVAVVGIVP